MARPLPDFESNSRTSSDFMSTCSHVIVTISPLRQPVSHAKRAMSLIGLGKLYKALGLSASGIAGTPEAEMAKMIERERRGAAEQ